MQKVVESLHKSKMAKQKSPNGNVSPVLMKYLSCSSSSSLNSSSNSRSSMDMGPFSPVSIMSKLSSSCSNRGQMSAVDEEDVLVMDGLPIMRYSPSPSPSTSSSKTELYKSRGEFGMYHFGNKFQFAHGKEELIPARFPTTKNKSEAQICKPFITGSCIYGSKCRFIHRVMTDSALVLTNQMKNHPMKASIGKTPLTSITFKSQVTNTSVKSEQTVKTTTLITKSAQSGVASTPIKDNWSPKDDDIKVTLPSHPGKPPSREKVDEYIDSILYCPSTAARRRLPVFAEIFPEY